MAFGGGIRVVLMLCGCAGILSASDSGVWIRDTLRKKCPTLYARSWEGYGWQLHQKGQWVSLPATLPARCVILVHGLDEPGKVWMNLAPALDEAGFTAIRFSYPNDQGVRDSAAFLLASLQKLRLGGVREIAMVAHSMGGLVCRELLTSPDLDYAGWRARDTIPCIRALIMVGTPNHGSALANLRVFAEVRDQWTRFVHGQGHLLGGIVDGWGEAGEDLQPDSPFLRELNQRPHPSDVRLTVISGVASPISPQDIKERVESWERGASPQVRDSLRHMEKALLTVTKGIGDGAVSLDSTRLEGLTDEVIVAGNHLSMIRNVRAASRRVPPAVPIILDRLRIVWPNP